MRGVWLLLVIACLALGWWLARPAGNLPTPPPGPTEAASTRTRGSAAASACPLPPRVARGDAPLQSELTRAMPPFRHADASLVPLAGFSIEARVLGSETYRMDREAAFAPLDLALGWGRMADDAVLARLQLSQGGRWYRYRWQGDAPIPREEIARSSANMHMIPADAQVERALRAIEPDQRVRIDGWLVQVEASDGWRWRSSLRRDDQGSGSCEVVYVCAVTRE